MANGCDNGRVKFEFDAEKRERKKKKPTRFPRRLLLFMALALAGATKKVRLEENKLFIRSIAYPVSSSLESAGKWDCPLTC